MFNDHNIDRDVFGTPFNYNYKGRHADTPIFESDEPDDRVMEDMSDRQYRAAAMATVLAWVDGKDFSYKALDALVVGMVDLDEDTEVGEAEEEDYNALWNQVVDAMVRLGADEETAISFVDDESDEAGAAVGKRLVKKMDATELEDEELITRFAAHSGEAILEAAVKVVRNGKVILKKKRVKKYRMSPGQKAALKKARRKANTAAGRRNRAKAMKIRKQRGL